MQQFNFNRQQAMADGYTPEQINQYLSSRQQQGASYADMQPTQQQPQQEQGNGFLDLLPLIGSVAGSFLPGLGTIAGGAVGAGAGALAKNFFDKKPGVDAGEVGKEALLGGAGGIVGKGLGFLGGKVAGALGGKLADAGQEIGIKGLRLNPSQISNFQIKHNEDVGRFLASEGALGKDSAALAEHHINPLQEQFNQIAKQSGLTVKPDTFLKNIDDQAQSLIEAGGSANKEIAQKLRNEALYVWQNDLTPANFDIGKVDKLRATFAKNVNWNDPEKASMNFAMADALRKTAIDTADEAGAAGAGGLGLQDIGIKLSKYRDLENAAIRQEALGRGNMPVGLTKWLGIIAGGGLMGGPGGAVAGLGANAIINSPKFLRFAASNTAKAGDALANAGEPGIAATAAGRTAAQAGVRAPFAEDQGVTDMGQGIIPQADASSGMADGEMSNKQDDIKKIIGAILLSKAKTSADVVAALGLMNTGAGSNVGKVSAKDYGLAKSGLKNIEDVRKLYTQDKGALTKQLIPGKFLSRKFDSALYDASDTLLRLRTGAQANPTEIRGYMKTIGPSFGDSDEVVAYKLKKMEDDLRAYLQGGSASPDTSQAVQ